jgi:hypothetical protein
VEEGGAEVVVADGVVQVGQLALRLPIAPQDALAQRAVLALVDALPALPLLTQLGKESGVATPQLSRFMRGERTLTLPAAEKICRALHLHLTPDQPPGKATTKEEG